jgi:hypothetical protein
LKIKSNINGKRKLFLLRLFVFLILFLLTEMKMLGGSGLQTQPANIRRGGAKQRALLRWISSANRCDVNPAAQVV